MGWKASLIFIKNTPEGATDKQVLDALWQVGWNYTGDATFEEALNADDDKTYIGRLNDVIIVGTADKPVQFLSKRITSAERDILKHFKDAEICALTLQSTVNHWGYSIIQNGEKIRVRGGNYEMPLLFDYGDTLPEEEDLLSKLIIKEDGSQVFNIDGEEYTYDQVGENFVFALTKRYTGYALDNGSNPMEQLTFRRYEKNPYVDSFTKASTPGELSVSDTKYELLEPEQYGYKKVPITSSEGSAADIKQYIQAALQNGDCNPAYVYQLDPLVIIAYAYDIDCIIPLLFPKAYQPPIELVLNQRLLSVNMYGDNKGELEVDLIEGKDAAKVWKNFAPHIAELYSDDLTLIEEKKATIGEEYWQKLPLLAKEYFETYPKRRRMGLNGYSGFPIVYKMPQDAPPVPDPEPPKKWWKFWA